MDTHINHIQQRRSPQRTSKNGLIYFGLQNGHEEIYAEFELKVRQRLLAGELLGSLGNGEFFSTFTAAAEDHSLYRLQQQLLETIDKLEFEPAQRSRLKLAIGVATCAEAGGLFKDCLAFAESAYRQALLSENRLCFYPPQRHLNFATNLSKVHALSESITNKQLGLEFQAKLILEQQALAGFVAIAGWQAEPGVWLSGTELFNLAEQFNLIDQLGREIFRLACEHQNNVWQGGRRPLPLAVYVSCSQFNEPGFVPFILQTLDEHGLTGQDIVLELTQTSLLQESSDLLDKFLQLKAHGLSLGLVNFGNADSTLTYLRQFPFDFVKIDRAIVSQLSDNQDALAIAKATLAMAQHLGLTVIADGVEEVAQHELLVTLGCDQVQGKHYAPALRATQINMYLFNHTAVAVSPVKTEPAKRLLLVDDERNILSALNRLLRRDGYQIFCCESAAEGLHILAQQPVDVIISDQRMPVMTGVEFLREARLHYPETVRIILSGYADFQYIADAINEGAIYKFLSKPWDDEQLRQSIADAFQYKAMQDENRRLSKELQNRNQELAKSNRQLKDALQIQAHQLDVDKVNLEVIDDILQQLALPILGLDDQMQIVFCNQCAIEQLAAGVSLYEQSIARVFPELSDKLSDLEKAQGFAVTIQGCRYQVCAKSMGKFSSSKGLILIFMPKPMEGVT